MKSIGTITYKVERALSLGKIEDRTIYIGDTNTEHMKNSHPEDYAKYGAQLENILKAPDYIGQNKKDGSIEYVTEFKTDNEYVKVAVRVSQGKKFYARSLYVLNNNRVNNFIKKGTLIPLDTVSEE